MALVSPPLSPPPLRAKSPDMKPKTVIPRRAHIEPTSSSSASTLPSAATLGPANGQSAPGSSAPSLPTSTTSLTTGTTAASSAVPSPPEETGSETTGAASSASAASGSRVPSRPRSPISRPRSEAGTSVAGIHTPQTGASRLAAAAAASTAASKRQAQDVDGWELQYGDDEHPLSERSLTSRGYQTLHAMQHLFHVENRWKLLRPLGQGAYGLVINVQDTLSGEPVAVKCITRVFDKPILARRALREITLLRHFGEHENLTGLIDLDNVWQGYNEIYLYMEPMEADLHQIVRSGQALSNLHIQFFLYQLLRGMKYIHSANVIHRDLKPGNLLVNSDCELKICDFGLARGFKPVGDTESEARLTEYVATRWYRAPEIMLSNRRYTTAIDVWSIGCILGELLGGKPMFKGKDYVDQLNLILGVLGTPDEETLARVSSEKARTYLKTLPHSDPKPLDEIFPNADADAIDLLSQLLTFDPQQRIDVATALQHPYVETYHDPADEPVCAAPFDKWEEVEGLQTVEELRAAITREISEYRNEVRGLNPLGESFEDSFEYDEEGEEEVVNEPEELSEIPEDAAVTPGDETVPSQRTQSRSPSVSPVIPQARLPKNSDDDKPVPTRPGMRRSSSHSVTHRRSMSFLFGGVGGMTSLSMTSGAGAGGTKESALATGSSAEGTTAGTMAGRRSRAPSSTVDLGSLRPLIRQLSATNLADINTDDDGAHSEPPDVLNMVSRPSSRGSRRGSSRNSRRPSTVCVAAEASSGWREEDKDKERGEVEEVQDE